MTAHIKLNKIDPQWPATLSEKVLQEVLRKQLGYRHTIITDDMEMKAITKNYSIEAAAVQAVKAGCNILLYCHELENQGRALEAIVKAVQEGQIPQAVIEDNYQRVLKLKKGHFPPTYKLVDIPSVSQIIGHPEHLSLAKSIAKKEVPAGLTT